MIGIWISLRNYSKARKQPKLLHNKMQIVQYISAFLSNASDISTNLSPPSDIFVTFYTRHITLKNSLNRPFFATKTHII